MIATRSLCSYASSLHSIFSRPWPDVMYTCDSLFARAVLAVGDRDHESYVSMLVIKGFDVPYPMDAAQVLG